MFGKDGVWKTTVSALQYLMYILLLMVLIHMIPTGSVELSAVHSLDTDRHACIDKQHVVPSQ